MIIIIIKKNIDKKSSILKTNITKFLIIIALKIAF